VLLGGALFVALHSVSDIGIYALLAGKIASYAAQHDNGLAYTLYLLTYALDSVADVFGSLFMLAAGLQILTARPFPRWLGWSQSPRVRSCSCRRSVSAAWSQPLGSPST
jgi:hypothetical protein